MAKNNKPTYDMTKNESAPLPLTEESEQELGDYVNEDGEKLMTEAEFKAKFELELKNKRVDNSATLNEELLNRAANEAIHDFLEFTISGCYYDSKKETIDFEGVKIKIPACDEDKGIGSMHVRGRYVIKALRQAVDKDGNPKYPKRIEKIRQVFVDDVVKVKGRLSFVGKDIKELSVDEMQDLATSKDLRFIPTPQSGMSKRDMLIRTYVAYADKVLEKTIKWQEENFNFAKLPSIILDATSRSEESGKITNEEMIDMERNSKPTSYGQRDNPEDRFTLEELKTIADSKNIRYANDVEFKDLYSALFSA